MNHATTPQGAEMIVLTVEEYRSLVEDAGDIAIAAAVDLSGPTMDGALLEAMLAGEISPLTAWRKSAGLSQAALAEMAGIRAATLSDIERGKINPRLSTMKALAKAIGVDIDSLV